MEGFECTRCNEKTDERIPAWRCPSCGGPLRLRSTGSFSFDAIDRDNFSLWRYREALPVRDDSAIVSLGEGCTPIIPVDIGGREILLKQEHLFPTGSFKDRGAAVLVSRMKELGIRHAVEDSSGNAGAAVAAYCAAAGISCDIYVPEATSAEKLAQIAACDARVVPVAGDRTETARRAFEAARESYYASHTWNPYFFQGIKTVAFEICEQLHRDVPDYAVLPAGNGTLLLGAFLGFRELMDSGVVAALPVCIAVQAAACAPVARAFELGEKTVRPVCPGKTAAEGIAIPDPLRGDEMLEAVSLSGGWFVTVDEREITSTLKDMCRRGLYMEPTAAATLAGLKKALEAIPERSTVLSVITGHGLKSGSKIQALLDDDRSGGRFTPPDRG